MTNIEQHLTDLARILSQKYVIVQMKRPITIGAIGETSKTAGIPIINLDPMVNRTILRRAFLHEVAHVKLHHTDQLRDTNDAFLPSASIDFEGAYKKGEIERPDSKIEEEADELGKKWFFDEKITDVFLWLLANSR